MFKVYAKDTIEIKSIELDSKSDNTTINSEPTFSGLEMNYDLSFKELNDFAKYKITIENNTNKEYQVKEDKPFNISEYVTYSYSSDQIIKANTTSTIYVIIKYTKAISDDSFNANGSYKETNKAVIEMYDENNNIVNPRTGVKSPVLVLTILMLFAIVMLIITSRRKVLFSILVLLLMVPLVIKGIEELKLTINVSVEISKTYDVVIMHDALIKYSEIPNYELHGLCKVIYIDEISDDNMYFNCDESVFEKYNSYSPGERVTLNKTLLYLPYNYINTCETKEFDDYSDAYLCSNESLYIDENFMLIYSYENSERYGFEFYDEDYNVMSFNNSNSFYSENEKLINFSEPIEFTMPGHDVLFKKFVAE